MVPSNMVHHQSEARRKRSGPEASARVGQLPDGLDLAPQVAPCHGSSRPRHIEVDETYVGGEEEGVRGRKTETKSIVVIAIEIHSPKGVGRVRLRQVPDVTGPSLVGFVKDVVTIGSKVSTDGWAGYNGLSASGYEHERRIQSGSGDPAHVVLPGPHRIASLLKRWLLGTHQGAVRYEHLDYYLDEYTFRFNRRSSKARGLLFHRLLEQAVQIQPTTYRGIVGGAAKPGTPS
jgi:transposase-like protein